MIQKQPGPVIPQRYLDAIGKSDPIESAAKSPKRLRRLIEGVSTKESEWQPAPGKWSIQQILAHLADGEVMIGSRLRLVAAMDRPTIVGYDQDAFVGNLNVDALSAEDWLRAFKSMRALNIALLSRLPQEAFGRIGLHTERGEESLAQMVFMYAGHDLIHEKQIAEQRLAYKQARKARRKAQAGPPAKNKSVKPLKAKKKSKSR
jgi:hypothetical protein